MKKYTEEMRLNDEYPTIGQKVILNILDEAIDPENDRQYNGSELIVVKNRTKEPLRLPIFYCVEHGFEISINNAHFKAIDSVVDNSALNSSEENELKSRAMASELNSELNDEWPKVGDKAVLVGDVCEVMSPADRHGTVAVKNEKGFNLLVFKLDLSKPKSKDDLLIEELQSKLIKNDAVDNWMLASNIINGDIEGLTYKGDSDD